jgi:pullulanase/glycogen debranching enzyme
MQKLRPLVGDGSHLWHWVSIITIIFSNVFGVDPFICQDDNATTISSVLTRQYNTDNDINTLDWPTQSPELHIIQNEWLIINIRLSKLITYMRSKRMTLFLQCSGCSNVCRLSTFGVFTAQFKGESDM